MGETAIDEDTFEEYLNEMRDHYTADKVSRMSTFRRHSLLTNWSLVSFARYAVALLQ